MHETVNVAAAAEEELEKARTSPHGRSARALVRDGLLRHTLLAILDGQVLGDHAKPAGATLQVLRGTFVVRSETAEVRLAAGEVGVLPGPRHDVTAEGDSIGILTTVAA
ncbi:LuxR family transcriptional regulator [Sinomonas cellulolyticus]|jgi:quercetin dioxygenase-like cupin family protein|uniref:Cupin n=1 Tax=Sinomonas cellulolyticus TaxID=2801916 RepID=A0ABS1K1B5_9MICC|nr:MULTISPECIES: cupin [Sinomonas]MBL0705480.1 cupin [Sinomonas cellulolyticus]GHG41410.1 LuxR family transcriptional regulator [Sinomonas sp. KCTC 49339]